MAGRPARKAEIVSLRLREKQLLEAREIDFAGLGIQVVADV